QALRDLVGTVVVADLFSHDEDALVALHLFTHRLVERFAVADDGHDYSLTTYWKYSSAAGDSSANFTASSISDLTSASSLSRSGSGKPISSRRCRERDSGSRRFHSSTSSLVR